MKIDSDVLCFAELRYYLGVRGIRGGANAEFMQIWNSIGSDTYINYLGGDNEF